MSRYCNSPDLGISIQPDMHSDEDKKHPSEESGSGELDYGANKPTGGTKANTGKINPQGPTSGTENFSHSRKKNQQTTAEKEDSQDNPDDRH